MIKKKSISKEKDDELGNARYNNFPSKLMNINIEKGNSPKFENKIIPKIENQKCIFSQQENFNNERELFKFNNVYDSMSGSENDQIDDEYSSFHLNYKGDFKKIWDMIIFFLILYSIIIHPYLISFAVNNINLGYEIFLECVFLIDFIFNFFTSFRDKEDNLITNFREIIKNYFKIWFFIDFVTCIPFSLIISLSQLINPLSNYNVNNNIKILMCLQWISLLRVLRLEKKDTNEFIKQINVFKKSKNNRLIKSSLYFFLIIHLTSCLWIFIGKMQSNSDINWIVGNQFQDYGNYDLYIASFYFNLVTVYSIGYGDILAFSIFERIYISLFMSISVVLFSYAISNFATFLIETDQSAVQRQIKNDVFEKIDADFDLPPNLYNKIKRYMFSSSGKKYDESYSLIEFLPNKLKGDLTHFISNNQNHLKKLCFFESQSSDFIIFILPMLLTYNLQRGDILFSVGEYVEEMYLVIKGSLSLSLSEEIEICQIRENNNFGELFFETNEMSPYEFKCKTKKSKIFVLKKIDYFKIKSNFRSNIKRILEKSYKILETIEKKRNIINEFLKFDNNPSNVKNFMKILKKEFIKNEINNDELNDEENFKEEIKESNLIQKKNSKEILKKDNPIENKIISQENEEKLSKVMQVISEENKDNNSPSSIRLLVCDSNIKKNQNEYDSLNAKNISNSSKPIINQSSLINEIVRRQSEKNITLNNKSSLNYIKNSSLIEKMLTSMDFMKIIDDKDTNKFYKTMKIKDENTPVLTKKTISEKKDILFKRINIENKFKNQTNIIMKAKKMLKNNDKKTINENENSRKSVDKNKIRAKNANTLKQKNPHNEKSSYNNFTTSYFKILNKNNDMKNESDNKIQRRNHSDLQNFENSISEKNKEKFMHIEISQSLSFDIIQNTKKECFHCNNKQRNSLIIENINNLKIEENKLIDFQNNKDNNLNIKNNIEQPFIENNFPIFENNSNEKKSNDKFKNDYLFKKKIFIEEDFTNLKDQYKEYTLKQEYKLMKKIRNQEIISKNRKRMKMINKHLDILLTKFEKLSKLKNYSKIS